MTNQNNAAQAAEQEAVRRVLEPYAESYDMMTRMAQREGNRPIVSTTAVAIDIRGNMIPGVIDALSKLRATVAEQKPIKLSDDVLQFLKDGVADATQCEESDVDQAFADQLLLLMHTPLYTEPPPKQRAVDWGPLVVAPVADERAAVDPCGYVAVKVSAVDWLKDKFPALTIKAGLCERIGGRLYTITRLMRDHDAALASAPVAPAEVMDALNWVDDFIARCNRDDRGSCESVNVLRRALASAPVADGWQPIDTAPAGQRVLLGPRRAPVVGIVKHYEDPDSDKPAIVCNVVHYNDTVLVADYHCSEWAPLASAPVAGEAREHIEQRAVNRYRPVPDGKLSYKVVAGDGTRSLYTGTKDSCLRVAAKLTEAFLDGAFVASDAAPQASAEPAQPCSCPSGDGSLRHPCAVHPKADKDGGQQRAEVTEAQCVAVYQALDEFGSGIDVYDFGLPGLDDHRRQKVVEIIRAALSATQPEQGERDA